MNVIGFENGTLCRFDSVNGLTTVVYKPPKNAVFRIIECGCFS